MGVNLNDVLGVKNENILEDKGKKQMNMLLILIGIIIVIILVVTFKIISNHQKEMEKERLASVKREVSQISSQAMLFYEKYLQGDPDYAKLIGVDQETCSEDKRVHVEYGGQKIEYKYGYYFISREEMNDKRLLAGGSEKIKASSKEGYAVNYANGDVVYLSGHTYQGRKAYEKEDILVLDSAPIERIIINTAEDMKKLQDSKNWNSKFYLNRDIDMSSVTDWNPVGTGTNQFNGSFDGKGYKILNFTIDSPNVSNIGLFGYVGKSGRISNLVMVNANVKGGYNTGVVAAVFSGTINDSKIGGAVTSGSSDTCGGVFGTFNGTANNILCKVDVSGKNSLGGFAGVIDGGKVNNVFVNRTVRIYGEREIGGLAGILTNTNRIDIDKSYAKATISASEGRAGGFIGYLTNRSSLTSNNINIKQSYSQGQIVLCPSEGGGFIGELLSDNVSATEIEKTFTNTQVDINCLVNRGGYVGKVNDKNTLNFNDNYWIKANNDNDANGNEIIGVGNGSNYIAGGEFSLPVGFNHNSLNSWGSSDWILNVGQLPMIKGEPKDTDWDVLEIKK